MSDEKAYRIVKDIRDSVIERIKPKTDWLTVSLETQKIVDEYERAKRTPETHRVT